HGHGLGDHDADAALLPGLRDVHAAQERVIADVVRRVAVRHLEEQLATGVEVDGRDHTVRRLHNRKSVEAFTEGLTATRSGLLATGSVRRERYCRTRLVRAEPAVVRIGFPARLALVARVELIGANLTELLVVVLARGHAGVGGLRVEGGGFGVESR